MSDDDIEIIRSEEEFQQQKKQIASLQIENKVSHDTQFRDFTKVRNSSKRRLNFQVSSSEISILSIKLNFLKLKIGVCDLHNLEIQIESSIKKAEMQNINYEFSLKEVTKKSDKQRSYIQQLEQQLEDQKVQKEKENKIAMLQDQIQTLQTIMAKENSHNQHLIEVSQQQLATLQEELQKQQSNLEIHKAQINELEEKLITQQNHYNTLNNEFQNMKEEKENLQQKADEYLQQIQSLIQQVGLTQSQQQETQNRAQELIEETNRQFQEKILTQQKLLEKLKHQIQEQEVTLEEQKKINHQKSIIIQDLQNTHEQNIALQTQIEHYKNELEKSQNDHKNYVIQKEEQEQKILNERVLLKQQIMNLDERIAKNKRVQQNSYETIQGLYSQLDEVIRTQRNLENTIQRLQNELTDKEKEKIALNQEIENLKQTLNDAKNEYQALHTLIQESPVTSKISGGKSQINSGKSQISDKSNKINFEKENELLRKQLDELRQWSQQKIEELQFALDQFQKQELQDTLGVVCQLIISKLNQIDFRNIDQELWEGTKASLKDPIIKFLDQLGQELKKKLITLSFNVV